MKAITIIYISILVIAGLISLIVLGLYYTQDFSENLILKDTIQVSEIKFTTNTNHYTNVTSLTQASVVIGRLSLENNGYFTKIYSTPLIYACINVNPNVNSNYGSTLSTIPISVSFESDAYGYRYNTQEIKIPVGGEVTKELTATIMDYRLNQIPADFFNADNLESISVYAIEQLESNPLGFDSYNYYRNIYNVNCETLKSENTPEKIIIIY